MAEIVAATLCALSFYYILLIYNEKYKCICCSAGNLLQAAVFSQIPHGGFLKVHGECKI